MPVSKSNYIHNNKNTITIGVVGEPRVTFVKSELLSEIKSVQEKSRELSREYSKNSKFPAFLGQDGETKILRGAIDKLDDILNDLGNYSPLQTREHFLHVQELAKSDSEFDKAFYGEVGKYYGVKDMPIDTIKQNLKKGTFKYVPSDSEPMSYSQSDASRYQDWIIKNVDGSSRYKVRRINNIAELDRIAQHWEQNKEVDESIMTNKALRELSK